MLYRAAESRCVIFEIPPVSENHEGQTRGSNVFFRLSVFASEEDFRLSARSRLVYTNSSSFASFDASITALCSPNL